MVKGKYLVLAGCILVLLAGCGKESVSNYELGTEDLLNKDYSSAIENFELSIAEEEQEAESLRGEGIAFYKMGRYEEAETAFSGALELLEDSEKSMKTDVLSYLAVVQFNRENYSGSVDTCNQLLDIRKKPEGYFLRGRAYLYLDSYEEAASDFNKMVSGSKDYDDYLDVYWVYEACDMKADGEKYLEMALELDGEEKEDHYNRGRIYYYLEEYDNAKEELTTSFNDGYQEAAAYLGKVYVELGDTANARAMYKECQKEESLQAKAYNGLAYCDIMDGDYDSALANIQKGLDTGDEEEKQELLFNEIVTYEKKSDYASAKEKMASYLELYPADAAAVKENYFLQTR